ncbi:MAG: HD domain-containing protein [Gemmatimonadaceae bacterium]
MTTTGYSDRINHALAFAAKHHDQRVRQGTRLPYVTQPANVAVILARYDQDDETVIAGILHDVIEDCVRESYTREMLEQRIADKFGSGVVDMVLAVTLRRVDDDGVELGYDDRRDDYLKRLDGASDAARWVCAADTLHNASAIVADLRRTIDPQSVWSRFTGGRNETIRWYRRVFDRLRQVQFTGAIMVELERVVTALETWTEESAPTVSA